MKDSRLESFPADAASALEFLNKDFDFEGPRIKEEIYVGYVPGRWSIWAILEERNKTVDTYVNYDAGAKVLGESVWDLVLKAKLRGAGQPKTSAITPAGVRKSLAAQAGALRLVLPLLLEAGGASLMER